MITSNEKYVRRDCFVIPFLLANFRSLIILSRERDLCPFRDEDSLELDESDEPESEALESDEPEPDELERFFFRRLFVDAIENEIGFRGGGAGGDTCKQTLT